jgi:exonuclease III
VSEEATVYRIADSYCLPDATKTSDHCPVALVLEMR